MLKEHVIFNSDASAYNFEDARKEYAECTGTPIEEISDEQVWSSISDDIAFWYEAEQDNLNKELNGRLIALGKVGTWHGSYSGYKILGDNLNNILDFCGTDEIKVYMDKHGVHSNMHHHDGTHCMEFRELREDTNIDTFLDKIYNGAYTKADIYKYTRSIRPLIKKIYGW